MRIAERAARVLSVRFSLAGLSACLSPCLSGPAVLVALAAAVPCVAQVKDAAPYAAVVTADNTPLRCGDGLYYRVADLSRGQVVEVDGESANWSRVAYPAGTPAYVKVEEATADEATATVRLKSPSALKAVHVAAGFGSSWKALLTAPINEGTTLKWLETVKDNGVVLGYKVVAPAGAKGYVENKSLRKANSEEAARVGLAVARETAKPAVKPGEAKPADAKPTETKPAGTSPAVTNLADPIVPSGVTPGATPGTPTPAALSMMPAVVPSVTPAADGSAQPTTAVDAAIETPDPKKPLRIGTLDQLESTFQAVRKQPIEQAELDALLTEFDRSIASAAENPEKQFQVKQLERRRDALKIIKEARDRSLALTRAQQDIDSRGKLVNQRLAELEAQRVYTIIGLLVPSTVYDGKRLPLMYRLQSVGSASPTTIGYLRPADALQLQTKVGTVVGVVGEASIDRSLMLNIIAPTRVDSLQAAVTGQPQSQTPSLTPGVIPSTNAVVGEPVQR